MWSTVFLALGLFTNVARCASPWPEAPRVRAANVVANLTIDEKVALCSGCNAGYGTSTAFSLYVGWSAGVPRLDIGNILWEDGPNGVADGLLGVTAFPSAMTVAQSWRPDLFETWGLAMGAEQRAKGSSVMLGPAVALVRVPWSGRVFEYFSEDPVLNSALSFSIVKGIQSNNISASVKHWMLNSQEVNRGDARGSPGMSSNIDERTARELYVPPYAAAVDAGVGTVMCAFVRVNNTYACENSVILNELLFSDLGFAGTVVSDWTATHSSIESALNGLTVEMEWKQNSTYFGENLKAAVLNGSVPLERLNDMANRVLTTIFATTDIGDVPLPHSRNTTANVTSPIHSALAYELAVAGTVLLKNNGLLPLEANTLCRIVIAGDSSDIISGGGSGGVVPPYIISAEAGLQAQLPGTTIISAEGDNATAAAIAAADADVAIVIVGMRTSEGMDRLNLSLPWPQDEIVRAILAVQPKTVVVTRCSGACLLPWAVDAPAIVSQLYAGQESGNALADILLGNRNPAGKLTVTWPQTGLDTWLSPSGGGPVIPSSYPGVDQGRGYPEVNYSEGLFVGYRWFDNESTNPLFCFGHGLSYSKFNYGNLTVLGSISKSTNVTITFTITNDYDVGVAGAEVAQLYVAGAIGDPIRALKAFAYTDELAPGELKTISFSLSTNDTSRWSVEDHSFVSVPPGLYDFWIGSSSRDFRLQGQLSVV
jgi:beta-glucosidase